MEKQQITTWLFVSKSKDRLENTTLGFLQRKLCSIHSTTPGLETLPCMASNCRQLKHHEHHSAYWLKPHKATYLVEDLALLFEITHFARTHEQPCFFIIEQAELLSTTCANKLLKLLEEPSEGYFFILTTTQPLKILPTIASRCVTQFVDGTYEYEAHPLLLFFFPTPKLYLPF
jgi:DNA polymerase-3 subunit delta'